METMRFLRRMMSSTSSGMRCGHAGDGDTIGGSEDAAAAAASASALGLENRVSRWVKRRATTTDRGGAMRPRVRARSMAVRRRGGGHHWGSSGGNGDGLGEGRDLGSERSGGANGRVGRAGGHGCGGGGAGRGQEEGVGVRTKASAPDR
ncbi:glycine-rich cell wall structural protein 1-like [Phragmites australis]|uniref:glycine-rich cell wall structural protein 1-like n=1 Tax=Phragmites australis TaxID=29695 RepID=UPI002D76F00E|nr:glycine-rich cell wall structural protein 1-like [Phragmites australis]